MFATASLRMDASLSTYTERFYTIVKLVYNVKMLKRIIILLFLCCTLFAVSAQTRSGFVNTEYILKNIPDYQKAQKELNDYSAKLQGEVDAVYKDIADMKSKYNSDKVFLTPNLREQREKEIAEKEHRAQLLQQAYFGPKGELFIKREELVKPIQDEVNEAIKDVAKDGNFGVIHDISADASIVYYDQKLDRSQLVLKKLGYSAASSSDNNKDKE